MIPYHKPYKFNREEIKEIKLKISGVLHNKHYSNHYNVGMLERRIAEIHKVKYAIATSSCTSAIWVCLKYLNTFSQYHEFVDISNFTWKSVVKLFDGMQYVPSYRDIDRETWLQKENPFMEHGRTIYQHTFGNIGKSNLSDTIYDASHCLGAKFEDIGMATCLSLAPTKLITAGEGGIILSNNSNLAVFATKYRDHSARMSEFNAIVGLQNLKLLDEMLRWKKYCRICYENALPGRFQKIDHYSTNNTIGFLNIKNLKIPKEIETRKYYVPVKRYDSRVKNSRYVYERMVCLPSWYDAPIEKIVKLIKEENNL
jgi:perosamine synthetase